MLLLGDKIQTQVETDAIYGDRLGWACWNSA